LIFISSVLYFIKKIRSENSANAAVINAKGTIIEDNKDFLKSDSLFYYAMALAKSGDQKKATLFFDQINRPFSNYAERLKYGEYLISMGQKQQAKKIFEELVQESLQASKPVKRKFRTIFIQVKNRLETI
jgi:hypothetical protein